MSKQDSTHITPQEFTFTYEGSLNYNTYFTLSTPDEEGKNHGMSMSHHHYCLHPKGYITKVNWLQVPSNKKNRPVHLLDKVLNFFPNLNIVEVKDEDRLME